MSESSQVRTVNHKHASPHCVERRTGQKDRFRNRLASHALHATNLCITCSYARKGTRSQTSVPPRVSTCPLRCDFEHWLLPHPLCRVAAVSAQRRGLAVPAPFVVSPRYYIWLDGASVRRRGARGHMPFCSGAPLVRFHCVPTPRPTCTVPLRCCPGSMPLHQARRRTRIHATILVQPP